MPMALHHSRRNTYVYRQREIEKPFGSRHQYRHICEVSGNPMYRQVPGVTSVLASTTCQRSSIRRTNTIGLPESAFVTSAVAKSPSNRTLLTPIIPGGIPDPGRASSALIASRTAIASSVVCAPAGTGANSNAALTTTPKPNQ